MNKEEILQELKKQFKLTKKKLNFKANFEEIEEMSYIEDLFLSQGFVSNKFSRQIINRMTETIYSWINQLYSWLYPGPMDFIHINENKNLSEEEKKEIIQIIDKIMYFVRKNKRIAFDKNIKEEGKFIDELVEFNKKDFKPFMSKYHKKFEKLWKEEIKKEY